MQTPAKRFSRGYSMYVYVSGLAQLNRNRGNILDIVANRTS